MYDSVATLKAYGEPTYDGYGNEFVPEITTTVYVQPRGVFNAEFYNAAQAGLHPSVTFELANRADYAGQLVINWEGEDYNVIRTDWDAQRDAIRLICATIPAAAAPPTAQRIRETVISFLSSATKVNQCYLYLLELSN